MRSYWLWLIFLIAAWLGAMLHIYPLEREIAWRLLLSAMFFAVYFLLPLIRERPALLTFATSLAALLAAVALWPAADGPPNPYPLILFALLVGHAAYSLKSAGAAVAGAFAVLAAFSPVLAGYPSLPLLFLVLFTAISAVALIQFRVLLSEREETAARGEALLSEYRRLKRRLISDEEAARQEERAYVGREIHDSVGHKLSALLMQLEVYRLKSGGETREMLTQLKGLAKESLEETRNEIKGNEWKAAVWETVSL